MAVEGHPESSAAPGALETGSPGPSAPWAQEGAGQRDFGPRDDELLACGASLAALWDDGPAPGHDRCGPCAAARAELADLDRTVHAAVAETAVSAQALAARVMDTVRTELRPGPLVPLGEPEGWITETAAARLFRRAAETISGVAAGSCRITALSGRVAPRAGRLPREPLRVRLEIAADLSRPLPEAVQAVRSQVLLAADRAVGLDVAEVDITVTDLLDDPHGPGGFRPAQSPTPDSPAVGGPDTQSPDADNPAAYGETAAGPRTDSRPSESADEESPHGPQDPRGVLRPDGRRRSRA